MSTLPRPTLPRRRLLATACAATALPRRARAEAFTLRYASFLPAAHPLNVRMGQAIGKIRAETGGTVDIAVFPDSQLGGETEMLSMLLDGRVDLLSSSAQVLGRVVPLASITSMGFAFTTYDQVWGALDGALGAYVRDAITASGMVVFDRVWDDGFRQLTTDTKAVKAVADLKGLRIGVAQGPVALNMFRALGAVPASLDLHDLAAALKGKVFEGQDNPPALVEAEKFYETQHLCAMTSHIWDGFWLLANADSYARLPRDLREIVARNFNAAALAQRADMRKLNDAAILRLTGQGMVFNTPEKLAPFRAALHDAGFYTDWKRRYGIQGWSLLERATGPLA